MRAVRAAVLGTVLAALASGLLAPPAPAVTTWSGSCAYEGWNQFWPGEKWVPEPAGYHYVGKGPCKGTLNGAPFDGQGTIDIYANMKQPMGCSVGGSTGGGPMYMTFLTGAANRVAAASAAPSSRPKPHSKKRKHRSHRKKAKRAHHAAFRAAASDPPPDPSQPGARPPAPTTADPVLTAWTDEANVLNRVTSYWYGAYRGMGTAVAENGSDPKDLAKCGADGVLGVPAGATYSTITEMRG